MLRIVPVLLAALLISACSKSDQSGAPATEPTSGDRIKQDLKDAGQNLKSAATEASTQIKPAYEKAKEEGREAVHGAAEKVAQWTDTQPATTRP